MKLQKEQFLKETPRILLASESRVKLYAKVILETNKMYYELEWETGGCKALSLDYAIKLYNIHSSYIEEGYIWEKES